MTNELHVFWSKTHAAMALREGCDIAWYRVTSPEGERFVIGAEEPFICKCDPAIRTRKQYHMSVRRTTPIPYLEVE